MPDLQDNKLAQEQEPSTNQEQASSLAEQALPNAAPEKEILAESSSSSFSEELEKDNEVKTSPTVEQVQEKISKLEEKGLITSEVANHLASKLENSGSGIMRGISPDEALKTIEVINDLATKHSPEQVAMITTVGFARGGGAGIRKYASEVGQLNETQLVEQIASEELFLLRRVYDKFDLLDKSISEQFFEDERFKEKAKTVYSDFGVHDPSKVSKWHHKLGGLTPNTKSATEIILGRFGDRIIDLHGYAKRAGDHSKGLAIDPMVFWDENAKSHLEVPAEARALGQEISEWVMHNHEALGVKYIIWGQKIWNPAKDGAPKPWSEWRQMEDRGNVTQNHWDHPHISFKK